MPAGKPVPAQRALCPSAERLPGPGADFSLQARGCRLARLCIPGGGWLRAAGGKRTFRGEGDPPWTPASPAVRTGCPVLCGGEQSGQGWEAGGSRTAAGSVVRSVVRAWGRTRPPSRGFVLRGAGSLGGLHRRGSGVAKPHPCMEGLCLTGTEYCCLSRGTVFVVVNKRTFQSLLLKQIILF